MSTNECRSKSKCGYCGWILFGTQFLQHECFASFNKRKHVIVVDDNGIMTMNTLTNDSTQDESLDPAMEDEILIDAVCTRKPLWDHTLEVSERTKLKKDALWIQISNIMGGRKSATEVKKRWQYLRDCFGKAKKKMKTHVPSGSGGDAGHSTQSTFRYYDRMQFLQPTLVPQDTVDSLPQTIHQLNGQSITIDAESQSSSSHSETERDCESPSQPSTTRNVRIRRSSSSSSCVSERTKKRSADTSDLEAEFFKYFVAAQPKRDATDSFLEQLGDILRRIPYIQRRNFQLRILTQAIEEEDKVIGSNN